MRGDVFYHPECVLSDFDQKWSFGNSFISQYESVCPYCVCGIFSLTGKLFSYFLQLRVSSTNSYRHNHISHSFSLRVSDHSLCFVCWCFWDFWSQFLSFGWKLLTWDLFFYLSGRESCQFISKLVVILDWDGKEFTVKKIEGDKLLKNWTDFKKKKIRCYFNWRKKNSLDKNCVNLVQNLHWSWLVHSVNSRRYLWFFEPYLARTGLWIRALLGLWHFTNLQDISPSHCSSE